MSSVAPRALSRRLKGLREEQWPDAGLTQAQLARALGGLSISLISSWENAENPVRPPIKRLKEYATLFATRRSLDADGGLVLLDDLTDEEHDRRKELLDELMWLRKGDEPVAVRSRVADLWTFDEADQRITIVCAQLPDE